MQICIKIPKIEFYPLLYPSLEERTGGEGKRGPRFQPRFLLCKPRCSIIILIQTRIIRKRINDPPQNQQITSTNKGKVSVGQEGHFFTQLLLRTEPHLKEDKWPVIFCLTFTDKRETNSSPLRYRTKRGNDSSLEPLKEKSPTSHLFSNILYRQLVQSWPE